MRTFTGHVQRESRQTDDVDKCRVTVDLACAKSNATRRPRAGRHLRSVSTDIVRAGNMRCHAQTAGHPSRLPIIRSGDKPDHHNANNHFAMNARTEELVIDATASEGLLIFRDDNVSLVALRLRPSMSHVPAPPFRPQRSRCGPRATQISAKAASVRALHWLATFDHHWCLTN